MAVEPFALLRQMVPYANVHLVKMAIHFLVAHVRLINAQIKDHVNLLKYAFKDVVSTNVKVFSAAWVQYVILQQANVSVKRIL